MKQQDRQVGGNTREKRVPNKSGERKKKKTFPTDGTGYLDVIKRRHISQGMMER